MNTTDLFPTRFMRSLVAAFTFVPLVLLPASALGADLESACTVNEAVAPVRISCDFRLTAPVQPESVRLFANGEPLASATFTPFLSSGEKSAWLYLIDTSNPRRTATVAKNVAFVAGQANQVTPTRLAGVATFSDTIRLVSPVGANREAIVASLAAIKADGVSTELFSNAIEAIKELGKTDAARKGLVIMSDGKAEDTAYALSDVVKAARAANVAIYGLGFLEAAADSPRLQPLRRLAEETGGAFVSIEPGGNLTPDFAANFTRHLENGGTVSSAYEGKDADVAVTLAVTPPGRPDVKGEHKVTVTPPPAEPEEPVGPQTLAGKIYAVFDSFVPGASGWADRNSILAFLLLLVPLLVIAAVAVFLKTRRQDIVEYEDEFDLAAAQALDAEPVTSIISGSGAREADYATRFVSNDPVLGYFEIVGAEESRYPVTARSIAIGRHSENDLQLSNDSVHRHHAQFNIAADGRAFINDLDTRNGVIVNGKRVARAELHSGDLIELGEVRLRYVSA